MRIGEVDYISLTDLAKQANPEDPSGVIRNWMSNKNSFDYYSLWEEINNEKFNSVESHRIKKDEVGYNRFTMTPNRWKKIQKSHISYKYVILFHILHIYIKNVVLKKKHCQIE